MKIHAGKLEQFKTTIQTCLDIVREKDKGTLQYDFFFNNDNTKCILLEKYVDSDALLKHMENMGELLGTLVSISDVSTEVCGVPSEALLKAAQGFDITVYKPFKS